MNTKLPEWDLSVHTRADAPGSGSVLRWLREHNQTVNPEYMRKLHQPEHHAAPLVVVAESAEDVLGGLLGETSLAWLKINIMAVDARWRRQGIGSALLAEAEKQARQRGCRHAYVDTMCYQAPEFYLQQGYQQVGEIPDWDSHGHAKKIFRKDL